MDFGEGPEEENPKGPKFVNKRLSSGCDRLVGVTYPKTRQNNVSTTPFGISDKGKGMRDTHCGLHPYLWRNTSHARVSDDVCGSPTRCGVVSVIHNMMWLGWKRL